MLGPDTVQDASPLQVVPNNFLDRLGCFVYIVQLLEGDEFLLEQRQRRLK